VYLRNAWYVAATEDELTDGLLARRILGENLVLFRASDGGPVALEDACAHRKLPLSMGRKTDDGIECGYHGMVFDCSGTCLRIPGQDQVPKQAGVRSYSCIQKWGWVWIWMGEASSADPSMIIDVPMYGQPGWALNRGDPIELSANYQLITDNLVDPTHVSYVHKSTLGNSVGEGIPLKVTSDASSVTASRWTLDAAPAPLFAKFGNFAGNVDRWQIYSLKLPALSVIEAGSAPVGSGAMEGERANSVLFHSYNFITPIDDQTSRYYFFQIRNFATDDEAVTQEMSDLITLTFLEDKLVLEAVQAGMSDPNQAPINIASDTANLKGRRMLASLINAEAKQQLAAS
jgi:phenylpropionate dioxygenase-like ring-hydroxylating dioxygenase large terminal subunit